MAEYPTLEERSAARQYLEHDHASEHLSGSAREEANRHAQEIDEQHARARDIALTGTARELGKLPKHLSLHQAQARKKAGINTEHAARIRANYRQGPPTGEREGRNPRPNRASVGRRVLDADPLDLLPDISGGQLIAQVIAWGAGLSILYLLLTHNKAASGLATGLTNVTRAIVAVGVDPLNPHGIATGSAHAVKPTPSNPIGVAGPLGQPLKTITK